MAQPLVAGRPVDWVVVVLLGTCQLGVPYLFLSRAVPQVRALEVGLFLLIEPVLNPIWAWLVSRERPGLAGAGAGRRARGGRCSARRGRPGCSCTGGRAAGKPPPCRCGRTSDQAASIP